jgi:3',5'-cyclic AMP phosphodiesterase CpdA
MKFIHLSDLHIHTHSGDNKEVSSVLSFLIQNYPHDQLIITGDIADDGTEKQLENAREMLQPFKGRIFICPGNHDFGAVGNFYSDERALRFDRILMQELNQGGTFKGDTTPVVNIVKDNTTEVMLIALDSNIETEHPFDFACGAIGESQLRALDTILGRACNPGTVKVLFFHHHPFCVNNPFMELKDAEELARTVYNRVDLILFGHKHEMKQWDNTWGAKYILAADNSPGKNIAKRIIVEGTTIKVEQVPIA